MTSLKPVRTDTKSLRSGTRLLIGLVLLFVVLILAAIAVSRVAALAPPAQPVAFSHRVHDDRGIDCLYCHPHALRSDIAGIPSVQLCVGCHETISKDTPQVQDMLEYWERGEPIPWNAVNDVPDHVFFSHMPHVNSGMNCETCHGPVGSMEQVRPVSTMDMGWCLRCHLEQPQEKVARLADCMACHQ